MTTYSVAADGSTTPTTPAFPQPTLNDILLPDGSYDQTSVTASIYIDGSFTLQSLFVGSAIEVDLGVFSSASLTGTGSITGSSDQTKILPAFVNYGVVDINGGIDTAFSNYDQLAVSSGEKLALEGDYSGLSASTITVASGGELDIDSLNTAIVSALSSRGTLKVTAPTATLSGATTLAGTVLVQGDAPNGFGSGTLAARSSSYVATLDLRQTTLSAPISNLTLGQDAQIRFGASATTVQRFVVAGSASALVPLDVVNADGTVTIAGDGSGAANQVAVTRAEFAGGHTIDFTVAASDGGASLSGPITVDAGTTLRNDGKMTIGGQSTGAALLGVAGAAAGSAFINAGQLTITPGGTISVAAIQNTGTIDVASGTLGLEVALQGTGTITVENGATLSVDAAAQGNVALVAGGTLKLSQPATFAGTIQAPANGAKLDLTGVSATSATVTNGTISVATAAGTISLAETGLINGTTLALSSDGAGGSLLTVDASNLSHPVAYRFFDTVRGTHFYTTSQSETQSLQATRTDLVYEGVGLGAANPTTDPAAAPVYRFFDTKFGTHFYTASATERDTVLATRPDLVSEGTGFYEHTTQQLGDVAVYRFFDSQYGTHFYTSSATERANVIATRPDLVSEGIGFYAPTTST